MTATPSVVGGYSFDPFARHEFYTDVNRALVRRAVGHLDAARPAGAPVLITELASGTGAVTALILDELERLGRPGAVIGVEPSEEAIVIARENLRGRDATFKQGDSSTLAQLVQDADAAFFCNAIHLIPDKGEAMRHVVSALAPDGFFAWNSSFYEGAYAPGSERFYRLWIRNALGWLRENAPGSRPSRTEKAPAMLWLTPHDYAELAAESGLRVVEQEEDLVHMPLRSWQDIGNYWLFIEGALPGVPVPIAAKALESSAAKAFEELGISDVPRMWLQMVARRK
ncbi:MAG TPA: class I SAM-dependent methyltransferase [Ktedonobacterales bacterium]